MTEIERKFLVNTEIWSPAGKGNKMVQGYLSVDSERSVRVRISGEKAWLTIKGKLVGISRQEFEYKIPVNDARELLKLCLTTPISKTRYFEKINGKLWEIDVFEKQNKGLVLAEIELEKEDETIELPNWILNEVSNDRRYFNSQLSQRPYKTW